MQLRISKAVRDARLEHGLTQAALADKAGVTSQCISNLERGRVAEPSTRTLRALARVLGLSLDKLCGNKVAA